MMRGNVTAAGGQSPKFSEVFSTTAKVVISLLLLALLVALGIGIFSLILKALSSAAGAAPFLYAAYTATWLIHIFYIGTLVRRYGRLRRQMRELGKTGTK